MEDYKTFVDQSRKEAIRIQHQDRNTAWMVMGFVLVLVNIVLSQRWHASPWVGLVISLIGIVLVFRFCRERYFTNHYLFNTQIWYLNSLRQDCNDDDIDHAIEQVWRDYSAYM